MTPSELAEWQSMATGRKAFVLKRLAQSFVESHKWRYSTKVTKMSQLSSFWYHNYAPWPRDPGFDFSSDVPPVVGELTKDHYCGILLNSDRMYRAVFLFLGQGLIGVGELVYVNVAHWELVLESLTKNVGIFKIPLPGRKATRNKKTFYTMLSTKSDWGDAMRDYLKSLRDLPHGALFRNQNGAPITYNSIYRYFHRRAVEAGVIKECAPTCGSCGGDTVKFRKLFVVDRKRIFKVGYKCRKCGNVDWAEGKRKTSYRYGVNPHEIRDLMRSRWGSSGADEKVAEFMMEHDEQVDPNEYLDWTKYQLKYPMQQYRKALPWLNVLSEDPEKVSRFEVQGQLEASEAKVDALSKRVVALTREVELGREAKELLTDPEVLAYLKQVKKKAKE